MPGFRRIADTEVHQGHVWRVVIAEFEAPDGTRFRRDIVRSPGAVAIVPLRVDESGRDTVVLMRQFRPAYERDVLEIPAGMRDIEGEPVIDTGRRELAEEAGLVAASWVHLIDMIPQPGMSDSVTTIWLATDLTAGDRDLQGPEEAHSELVEVPLADAVAMIERGEIVDAKSVVGLLLTERRRRPPE
jgi:8-oxo-dGTP pyrophosphatase MutT (NUDIX family)